MFSILNPGYLRLPPCFVGLIVLKVLLAAAATAQGAEPYRLISGDHLRLSWAGVDAPIEAAVDIDGNLRLVEIGAISVAGLSLDQVEARISDDLTRAGLYQAPQVRMSMTGYAPVIVIGDVAQPGRFDYFPGMTVAAAIAMAGGPGLPAETSIGLARLEADLKGQARALELEITSLRAEQQRLLALLPEAALDGLEGMRDMDRAEVSPSLVTIDATLLQADQRAIHDALIVTEREIEALASQQGLIEERIDLQRVLASGAQEELARVQALHVRGLSTSIAVSLAETRAANVQSDLLETETALVNVVAVLARAEQQRVGIQTNHEAETLRDLRHTMIEEWTAAARLQSVRQQLRALKSSPVALGDAQQALLITISSVRSGRGNVVAPDLGAQTMPGDTVFVSWSTAGDSKVASLVRTLEP